MSKKEKEINTLDKEIQLIQIEKFINDFDTAMKKDLKSRFKKLALGIVPLSLSLIGYLIFKNPVIITIGTGLTGVSVLTTITKDFIGDIKELKPKNKSMHNLTYIEQEKDVEQILQDGIGKSKGEDFYTERYKSLVEKNEEQVETEEERKYREALEKQQEQNDISTIKVDINNEDFLDKDETMVQIVKEIEAYTIVYNIPPIKISNHQWELYFNSAYELFTKKGIERRFYDLMSQVGRFTFSKSLLSKKRNIDIYNFIENLCYLKNEEIPEKDILKLQKEILDKLPTAKIIDFSNYVKSGKKK